MHTYSMHSVTYVYNMHLHLVVSHFTSSKLLRLSQLYFEKTFQS